MPFLSIFWGFLFIVIFSRWYRPWSAVIGWYFCPQAFIFTPYRLAFLDIFFSSRLIRFLFLAGFWFSFSLILLRHFHCFALPLFAFIFSHCFFSSFAVLFSCWCWHIFSFSSYAEFDDEAVAMPPRQTYLFSAIYCRPAFRHAVRFLRWRDTPLVGLHSRKYRIA